MKNYIILILTLLLFSGCEKLLTPEYTTTTVAYYLIKNETDKDIAVEGAFGLKDGGIDRQSVFVAPNDSSVLEFCATCTVNRSDGVCYQSKEAFSIYNLSDTTAIDVLLPINYQMTTIGNIAFDLRDGWRNIIKIRI